MRKILCLSVIIIAVFSGCAKDHFFDKFVPEILYYQNADVENADFTEATMAAGATEWTVKARVSAPMKLKEIKLFKVADNQSEVLLKTYTDFQLTPNVFNLNYIVTGISAATTLKIVATDNDNKSSSKNFAVKK